MKNRLNLLRSSCFSILNLLNWNQKRKTPLRHVSHKTA